MSSGENSRFFQHFFVLCSVGKILLSDFVEAVSLAGRNDIRESLTGEHLIDYSKTAALNFISAEPNAALYLFNTLSASGFFFWPLRLLYSPYKAQPFSWLFFKSFLKVFSASVNR